MKLTCHLFGHKSVKGYEGTLPYFKITARQTDGINREHATLQAECVRCDEKFPIGMIHLPEAYKQK